jgi:hypothetical protein
MGQFLIKVARHPDSVASHLVVWPATPPTCRRRSGVRGGEVVGEVAQDGADLAGEFDGDRDSLGEAGGVPVAVAEAFAVSMGDCIASALTGASAVEVAGAIVGTVGPGAGGALAAVAAG